MGRLLLLGATGAIGKAVAAEASKKGFEVIGTARTTLNGCSFLKMLIPYFGLDTQGDFDSLALNAPYDAICWAQGINCNDSVYHLNIQKTEEIFRANCTFILISLHQLLEGSMLKKPARMIVISSIWEKIARQNKLSYTMSKAAIGGLVRACAIDLGQEGHLINSIMPGVLNTPMTHTNLTKEQFETVENSTLFKRLANLQDIASLTAYLLSEENQSITGQSIPVDLGFTYAHFI